MQVKRKKVRVLRWLGKSILGLLIFLLGLLLILHIPFVQKYISKQLPGYLSERIGAKVELQNIGFSIMGCAEVQGLKVWDPNDKMILSIDHLGVKAKILDILVGDFILKEVELKGAYGRLTQKQNKELNIQYVLDVFKSSKEKKGRKSKFHLQCDHLDLEQIDFAFQSMRSQVLVATRLDHLEGRNIQISPNPTIASADSIRIDRNALQILYKPKKIKDTINVDQYADSAFDLNIDLKFGINVNSLQIAENSFSIHKDTVIKTPKFDPTHLTIEKANLNASSILLHNDTLNFVVQNINAQLPGFDLEQGNVELVLNQQELDISELQLISHQNNITADVSTRYENINTDLDIEMMVNGQIDPKTISYFLTDAIVTYIGHWTTTDFNAVVSSSAPGHEKVKVELKTKNSQLGVSGDLKNISEVNIVSWEDVSLQLSIGKDFRDVLVPIIGESIMLPGVIGLDMKSSGNFDRVQLDGFIVSDLGAIKTEGVLTPLSSGVEVDISLSSKHVVLGDWLGLPWLGPANLSVQALGSLGDIQNIKFGGMVSSVEIMNEEIQDIDFKTQLIQDSLIALVNIDDPNYCSQIDLEVPLEKPMHLSSILQVQEFRIGELLNVDSTLELTGDFQVGILLGDLDLIGQIDGTDILLHNASTDYSLDSLKGYVSIAQDSSHLTYNADDGQLSVSSNFDFREIEEVLKIWSESIFHRRNSHSTTLGSRTLKFEATLDDADPLFLTGMDIDSFSMLVLEGEWNEQKESLDLHASSGNVSAYNFSFDSLNADLIALGVDVNANITSGNLQFGAHELGDLVFDAQTDSDTTATELQLVYDSINVLSFDTRIFKDVDGVTIYPDELVLYDQEYVLSTNNPIVLKKENLVLNDFTIKRDEMQMILDGDLKAFDMDFKNLDLTNIDPILFPDSTIINKGRLNGILSYIHGQHLDLNANVDSLILLNSSPLAIELNASTDGGEIPFQCLISDKESQIELNGNYLLDSEQMDASMVIDIKNLEEFKFIYTGLLEDVKGSIKGEAKVNGPLRKPEFNGYLGFRELEFTLANPKLTFNVRDDSLNFDNNGFLLEDFVVFDNLKNPLNVSGSIVNYDYKSIDYDLNINTDYYALINRPLDANENLKGLLVLGSDIQLKGNENDTYVTAEISIKDTTSLVLKLPNSDNQLINTDEIIEFVDPSLLLDSSTQVQDATSYDSLIANLPDFTLTSKIIVEDQAKLRIDIDAQSGDYFEVSGKAELDLAYDRTGTPKLTGTYIVTEGVYSLSFYDLVKKDFELVTGSSINWTGGPEDGELDIKAVYTISSNSIGLVGHEVGDNEKSIYKKSLDYEVGINIRGTIEKPEIKFSLDLPEEDKITYPVLASKLDRLQLPEFQSDLNKQVFGLLVLGGFLPETTGEDANQNQIATTALYNSVNSVLAGQLNRFAGQYIKGVEIDVGIQSYNDYASNGGKTKTAMDFHVSKSIMDDRLVFEIGGDFDISADQSGANKGDAYRGDMAIIYDLTGNGDKQLKLFNNESYDIIYQEIRNTGISIIFIREFDKGEKKKKDK